LPIFFPERRSLDYHSVEKTIPGFFNHRLAKGTLANLTNFLAL
jgi:hypothetical protein